MQKCKKFSVYELPHRQFFEGKNVYQLFSSRFLRGKLSQIINSTYSTYYITLIPTNTNIIVFNNYIAHFPVWQSLRSRVHCVGIPHLQGCMVHCSWNFTIRPILSTLNSSFFKRTDLANSGQNVERYTILHNIFRCTFSYPCLLIRASYCDPFGVHNGFYHWLYIVINSINS